MTLEEALIDFRSVLLRNGLDPENIKDLRQEAAALLNSRRKNAEAIREDIRALAHFIKVIDQFENVGATKKMETTSE